MKNSLHAAWSGAEKADRSAFCETPAATGGRSAPVRGGRGRCAAVFHRAPARGNGRIRPERRFLVRAEQVCRNPSRGHCITIVLI